jgi:Rv2525c-like, glycoside hydrolase-like domain
MSPRRLAVIGLLATIGCGSTKPDPSTSVDSEGLSGVANGLDSTGGPSGAQMRSAGYQFLVRYLSGGNSKDLTAGELADLRANGIQVAVVWETSGTSCLGGYGAGVSDAQGAEQEAASLGGPSDRPIYFAIDFDAQPGDYGVIGSYFDGVASVLGRNRTGVYAGYYPVRWLFDNGKVRWAWQTYAWSYGNWDSRAQLRQYLNDTYVDGVNVDLDHAMTADYGQWGFRPPPPPNEGQRLAVAVNANGRLEFAYADDSRGTLSHDWQKEADGWTGWSGLKGLGGEALSLVMTSNPDGRLEVFYVGTDNAIYHDFQTAPNGGWYGQVPFGGKAKQLAIGKHPDGRIEVFYIGTDDALYHNWQTPQNVEVWSGQYPLGGKAKQLAVAQNADGRIEIFYVGTDDDIYHNFQTGTNGGWYGQVPLTGEAKQLAVGYDADGRIELFYVGTNDALYHDFQTPQNHELWSGEMGLGGKAKRIAVESDSQGRIELFYVGTDDALYHNFQKDPNGGWAGELGLGGKAKQIAVARNADGRLELLYIGTNEAMYHDWQKQPSGGWAGEGAL